LRIFAWLAEVCPDDKAASLMIKRCDRMLSLELRPDWDGVFAYDLK